MLCLERSFHLQSPERWQGAGEEGGSHTQTLTQKAELEPVPAPCQPQGQAACCQGTFGISAMPDPRSFDRLLVF